MQINDLIKQAQGLQTKMSEIQEKMAKVKAEGSSGAGLVKIILNGSSEMVSVFIDESLIEKDEKEMLGDLIVAAYNDAKKKIDNLTQNEMQSEMSGLIPAGFKLPF
jgi:nucleoid-associated protein EbfC